MQQEVPQKILVVDDEPDLELLVSQKFRRQIRRGDLSFFFARDGREALEQLGQDPDIKLVLSDINMPQMDGLALLEQIRQLNHDVCAVMVSAYGDMENIRSAMNRGAFDFITKPINFDDLETTINKTLSHLSMMTAALAARDQLVELRRDLDIASEMQQSILPHIFPSDDSYDVYATMETAREVGGDFYDVFHLEHGRIGLVMADVSGKGVTAALFMMVVRTMMKAAAVGHYDPGTVLGEVNDLVLEKNDAEMFVTTFYAVYDPETRLLRYANAGHNHPLLLRADGRSEFLASTRGIAIGVLEGATFAEDEVALKPGDAVFMYTDGVTEAVNAKDEEFGEDRLRETLASGDRENAVALTGRVLEAVHEFASNVQQADDITCMTLYCKGDGAPGGGGQASGGGSGSDGSGSGSGNGAGDASGNGLGNSAGDGVNNGPAAGSAEAQDGGESGRLDLNVKSDMDEIARIEGELTGFLTANGASQAVCLQIQLAVEEIVTNVISYSYDDGGGQHEIKISAILDDGRFMIDIVDDGKPFDPLTETPAPDIDASVEDRKIGGLGVFLTREMMDDVSYKREGGSNCLTLTKSLG